MKKVILATAAATALSQAAYADPAPYRINPCAAQVPFMMQLALGDNHNTPCSAIDCSPCSPCAAMNPCAVCSPCVPCNPCAAIAPPDDSLGAMPCNPCAALNPCAADAMPVAGSGSNT